MCYGNLSDFDYRYEDVIAKRDVVVSEIKMNKADRLWATEDILNGNCIHYDIIEIKLHCRAKESISLSCIYHMYNIQSQISQCFGHFQKLTSLEYSNLVKEYLKRFKKKFKIKIEIHPN